MLLTVVLFIHILLAIVAFGFNLSYSVWFARGAMSPDHLDFALRGVKFMDDYIANPAYLLLLITGLSMVIIGGFPLTSLWILVALITWVIAIGLAYSVYTPTIRNQITVLAEKGAESPEYQALNARGMILGIVEGVAVLLILIMMVFKPTL